MSVQTFFINKIIIVFSIMIIFSIVGCSSGNRLAPVSSFDMETSSSIAITDFERSIIGAYNLNIDKIGLQAEMIPLRELFTFDTIEAIDISNFLTLDPCTDCVRIGGIGIDVDGNIRLSIGIRHPFPTGDPTQPISGRNRADLMIYNVEGVLLSDSTINVTFPITGEISSSPVLLNADGYTNYLDETLDEIFPTETSVHPYILHFADYSAGNYDPVANPDTGYPFPNPQTTPPTIPYGHLVMAQGSDYDYREYVINPGNDSCVEFLYAVLGTYGVCATRDMRFMPECRVPQHHKKAASELEIFELSGSRLLEGNTSSSVDLRVEVVDTNHGCQVGSGLTEMEFASDVQAISVEIPEILNNRIVVNNPVPLSGDGSSPANPLVYELTVTNEKGVSEGSYYGLLKVEDLYPVGANSLSILNSKDAIKRVPPLISPLDGLQDLSAFATYFVFSVDVDPVSVCPNSFNKDIDKKLSGDVNIIKGIDERCISVSGNDIYIAYERTTSLGGCGWPPGEDIKQVRCLSSHDKGMTFMDTVVRSNYCESPFTNEFTTCITSNASGTVLIFNVFGVNSIVFASYDKGITFTNSKILNFISESDFILRPAIAMNSSGNVILVWINEHITMITIQNDYSIRCLRGNQNLNFPGPVDIVSDALIFKAFSIAGGTDCDAALDDAGKVMVVWTDAGGAIVIDPMESGRITYDYFNGTAFGTDKIISGIETGMNGRFPSICLGSNGKVHCAWHVSSPTSRVYISDGSITGGFSTPEGIFDIGDPSFGVRPVIAIDSSGAKHVTFCNRNSVSRHEDVHTLWKCLDDPSYNGMIINEPVYPSGISRPVSSYAILDTGELAVIWTTNENAMSNEGELRFAFLSPL